MYSNISPEEKLLRLIKNPKSPHITPEGKERSSITTVPLNFPRKFLAVNKVVFAAFIISCLYLLASFIYPLVFLRKIRLPQIKPGEVVETNKAPRIQAKPLAFYLDNIKNRAVFGAAYETDSSVGVIDRDLTGNISLVGIISGENPQAVIEDKKAGKTYYLNKGQLFGEFQLEDIQEGKVILNYKGHRYGLYL